MLAIVLGAPGTFAQISLYLYSMATIGVFIWGLKQIGKVRVLFVSVFMVVRTGLRSEWMVGRRFQKGGRVVNKTTRNVTNAPNPASLSLSYPH